MQDHSWLRTTGLDMQLASVQLGNNGSKEQMGILSPTHILGQLQLLFTTLSCLI